MNSRLKKVRKALNLNQTELGKKIGLSQTAVAKIERGDRTLTDRQIIPLVSVLGVSENWLKDGTGDMFVNQRKIKEIERIAETLSDSSLDCLIAMAETMAQNERV